MDKPGQTSNLHQLGVAKRFAVGAAKLLCAWPNQFDGQLTMIRERAHMSPSLQSTFGALYRVLYSDLLDGGYQFTRDVFEDHLRRHWWGLVCYRNGLLKPRTVENHPRRTIHHVAQAAHVGNAVVRHLVQSELIPAVTVTLQSGRRMSTIHEEAVPSLVALVDGAVTLSEAARDSALPERRLRQLIKAGLIRPLVSRVNQRAAAWLITKADMARLHIQVDGDSVDTSVAVGEALKYWRLQECEAVSMLRAVLDSLFVVHADACGVVPMGLARVDRQELKGWLLALRSTGGKSMSIDEAATSLGVKQQVAYELVKSGLLKSSTDCGDGRRVLPSDLATFQRDFVSLVSLAKAAKRSPKAMLDELRTRPVIGPCVDGARQYFYRRVDVADQAVSKLPAELALGHRQRRTNAGNYIQGASDERSAN